MKKRYEVRELEKAGEEHRASAVLAAKAFAEELAAGKLAAAAGHAEDAADGCADPTCRLDRTTTFGRG